MFTHVQFKALKNLLPSWFLQAGSPYIAVGFSQQMMMIIQRGFSHINYKKELRQVAWLADMLFILWKT